MKPNLCIILVLLLLIFLLLFYTKNNFGNKESIITDTLGNANQRKLQRIPYKIFQTFKQRNVPKEMFLATETWKNKNPEYDYKFFDDNDILDYCRANDFKDFSFSKSDFMKAYNKIKPGAGKADLFRYLIMYDNGGTYFDIDTSCQVPLREYIGTEDEVVSGIGMRGDLHQWGLIYIPKHPIMRKTLENSVYNILNENFIDNIKKLEYLTGPPALDISAKHVLQLPSNYRFVPGILKRNGLTITLLNRDYFGNRVDFKYKNYKDDLKKMSITYWTDMDIFNK